MPPKNGQVGQEGRSFIEEARRTQIIGAAIDVIAETGFARTSMARIAEQAGISRGLISYHFTGKAELIEQVLVTIYTDGAGFMAPRITAETTATGRLQAYIASNLEYMRQRPRRMIAIVEIVAAGGLGELTGATDRETDEQMLAPLEGIFREGQETGEFRKFGTTVMARIVRGAINAVPPLLSRRPDLDLDHHAHEIITAVDLATRAAPPDVPREKQT